MVKDGVCHELVVADVSSDFPWTGSVRGQDGLRLTEFVVYAFAEDCYLSVLVAEVVQGVRVQSHRVDGAREDAVAFGSAVPHSLPVDVVEGTGASCAATFLSSVSEAMHHVGCSEWSPVDAVASE